MFCASVLCSNLILASVSPLEETDIAKLTPGTSHFSHIIVQKSHSNLTTSDRASNRFRVLRSIRHERRSEEGRVLTKWPFSGKKAKLRQEGTQGALFLLPSGTSIHFGKCLELC